MSDFNYGKAAEDLYDSGCPNPDEIYEYKSEKGINDFMRENGLNPDNYKSGGNSGSSGNSSNSSGCFLTTACTEAKGLPDDCDELETLRAFRDGYLQGREGGEREIRYYYTVAPKIVEAVNKRDDAAQIWHYVYEELVAPCVRMIKDGQNEEAYELYKNYTMLLEQEFIPIA